MRTVARHWWSVCPLLLCGLLASTTLALSAQNGAPTVSGDASQQTPAAADDAVTACRDCHVVASTSYEASAHARTWDPRTPAAANGCESCHGPAAAHAREPASTTPRQFRKIAPRDVSETCMTCHNRQEHSSWQGSMHDARNITCVNCHSIHDSKSETAHLQKATVLETCGQCHREKLAKLQRSGHMPVREGKMTCTTCHNQHGSTNVRLLRSGDSVVEFCTSCHDEKRGPFLWDHPPVRESCVTCHDPHGSSNDRLLVARPPMLCQRCHVATRHPATPYDSVQLVASNNRLVNRGCVNCHSNIHGSNHPSGQFFHR